MRGFGGVVVFYGSTPRPLELLEKIEAPVFAHYGKLDSRITGGAPETEAAMKKYGKSYEYKVYTSARHAFFNDPSPRSYHPEATKETWNRTIGFFKKALS